MVTGQNNGEMGARSIAIARFGQRSALIDEVLHGFRARKAEAGRARKFLVPLAPEMRDSEAKRLWPLPKIHGFAPSLTCDTWNRVLAESRQEGESPLAALGRARPILEPRTFRLDTHISRNGQPALKILRTRVFVARFRPRAIDSAKGLPGAPEQRARAHRL